MNAITVQNIQKSYLEGIKKLLVLDDLSLSVGEHEILSLFGPNGCGKTTLINICAGLIKADSGVVQIFGADPRDVRIGYIPQAFGESLFPWLTNLDNICFPLILDGLSKKKAREEAVEFLQQLDISLPRKSYPYESSGGQKQLAALGRALVSSPSVLLADEPFSALDYTTRLEIQDKFLRVVSDSLRLPTIIISHQIEDAIYLGDRLIVLGKQPAQIMAMLEINLPRPRKQEMKKTPEFADLRAKAIDVFMRGVGYEG
jgi:NitT/TauT family transport system ATP-binding protein